MSNEVNAPRSDSSEAPAPGAPTDGLKFEAVEQFTRQLQPRGYITTDLLAALWDERARQAEAQRKTGPDDLKGLEQSQRRATQALQAYRFLAELEQQLGFEVALPILGPWRGADAKRE